MFLPVFCVTLPIFLASGFSATATPLVSLPYGTFRGLTTGNLTKFLGVPFAHAPRFELPKSPTVLHGVQNATEFGPACPQQALTPLPIPGFVQPGYPSFSEDCLTLNVFKPIASNASSKLPVLVWIYGGGFEIGNSRDADVSPVVERSIETNEPVIIVTPNYRLNALGFLGGKQVGAAGISNLGLRDQIAALEWVQKYISTFGGDPERVIVYLSRFSLFYAPVLTVLQSGGQSAGEIQCPQQSGTGSPFTSRSLAEGQADYDNLVAANNCTGSHDTLACLRHVPFEVLMGTVNRTADLLSYRSISLVWHPYVDGDVVERDPVTSISQGLYAKIPIMTGDCDDEGTIFSVTPGANVTTGPEFLEYVHSNYLPATSEEDIARIGELYPDDPTQGSPFNTGTANQLTPEYKRLAAFQGDFGFTAPRRFLLEHASTTQDTWSWLNKRGNSALAVFGVYHGSDTPIWFPPTKTDETTGVDAMINFINRLDPNCPADTSTGKLPVFWPKWNMLSSAGAASLLTFNVPDIINITSDNFRFNATGFLSDLLLGEAVGGSI
ncbi:sterol esterase [Mycena vulgaris]|nr:sterol esterase [Mycena vulgaris]